MIVLPSSEILIEHLKNAFATVEKRHTSSIELTERDWFPELAGEIAARIASLNIECYARGSRRAAGATNCVGSEWLFDFCGLIIDPDVPTEDRFVAQAAVVGEIEWALGGTDQDFEKLMVVDSLVLFFVFQCSADKYRAYLNRFRKAAERRRGYCRQRGITRLPAFLLSCWTYPDGKFEHEVLV
jgi:hypothetical protein